MSDLRSIAIHDLRRNRSTSIIGLIKPRKVLICFVCEDLGVEESSTVIYTVCGLPNATR